jgi:paraquat-inducible protein B
MSDAPAPPQQTAPSADVRRHSRFQLIWLIPIVAAIVAGYLAWHTLSTRGPEITISFRTADGITAGQTMVRHKAVNLGIVRSISLSDDLTHVIVKVQMRREATDQLTDRARFWVVRPRFTGSNFTGLDTVVSGAYIELDPGAADDPTPPDPRREFTGLDDPPAVRSDEPGQTYTLYSGRVGGISSGSPVLYRDVPVGEVLRTELGKDGQGFTVTIFVRKPYDQFVHDGSLFWDSSGVALDFGASGIQLRLESLQALLTGAVAFDTTREARSTPVSKPGASFRLFRDETTATSSGYKRRLAFVTRFEGSVRGLAVGSTVEAYGIPIGNVTGIKLIFDPKGLESHVDVHFEIQPERILPAAEVDAQSPIDVTRALVQRGMRVQIHTANYLTGQMYLGMDFVPGAPAAEPSLEPDGTIVLPGLAGGFDNVLASVTEISQKLARVPFDQIGQNLDTALRGVAAIANGQELKQSLTSLTATMASVQDLVKKFDAGASPALKRLPEIAQTLQSTLDRTNKLIGSADAGYGGNSQVRRDLERVLEQVSDTARSVRLLADFLTQHPEALISGRSGRASER